MTKYFCDRCKKVMEDDEKCYIEIGSVTNNTMPKTILYKEICKDCAINMTNSIDYECDRHILRPTVIVSKEAVDNNV